MKQKNNLEDRIIRKHPRMFITLFVILLILFAIMLPVFILRRDWLYIFLCIVMILSSIVHIRDIQRKVKSK